MSRALAKYRGHAGPSFSMTPDKSRAQLKNMLTTQNATARVVSPSSASSLAAIARFARHNRQQVSNVIAGAESNFGGALSHYINQQAGPARAVAGATVGEVKAGIKAAGSLAYEKRKTLKARSDERLKLTQEQEFQWLMQRQDQHDKMQYLRTQMGLSAPNSPGATGAADAATFIQSELGKTVKDANGAEVGQYTTPDSIGGLVQSASYQYNLSPEATASLRQMAFARAGVAAAPDQADLTAVKQLAQSMAEQNKAGKIGALGESNIIDALGITDVNPNDGTAKVHGTVVPLEYASALMDSFRMMYTGKMSNS